MIGGFKMPGLGALRTINRISRMVKAIQDSAPSIDGIVALVRSARNDEETYAAITALIAADTDRFREWFGNLPAVPGLPPDAQWAVYAVLGTGLFSSRILHENEEAAEILPDWRNQNADS